MILLPLRAEATGAAARDFKIEFAGDAHLNPVLAHILRSQYDIETEEKELEILENPPTRFNVFLNLLNQLEKSWKTLPQLTINPRIVVAKFLLLYDAHGR